MVPDPIPANGPSQEAKGLNLECVNRGEPTRLDLFLCENLPGRSRAFIQKLIRDGNISFPGELPPREAKPSSTVASGTLVRVTIPPVKKIDLVPENIPLKILYEDGDLAVIDKPAGLVVHPSPNQNESTLVHGLLYHLKNLSGIGGEERPGIVHRLDRDTSGILLVAKSDRAHQGLSLQFKARTISKLYWAILRGNPPALEGRLDLPIGRSYYHRKKMMVRTDPGSRPAVTEYRILEEFEGYSFAEIHPLTGRTHQIRVHMAKIRMPVACDQLYGRERRIFRSDLMEEPRKPDEEPIIQRQALHARSLRFRHPSQGTEMCFEADLPPDMEGLLSILRTRRPGGKMG